MGPKNLKGGINIKQSLILGNVRGTWGAKRPVRGLTRELIELEWRPGSAIY